MCVCPALWIPAYAAMTDQTVIADLIRNPEGKRQGAGETSQHQPTESPSPLMGEESKPVPVLDTGAEGEQSQSHHSTLWIPAYAGMTGPG